MTHIWLHRCTRHTHISWTFLVQHTEPFYFATEVLLTCFGTLILIRTNCCFQCPVKSGINVLVSKQDGSTCILVIDKNGINFHRNTPINFCWTLLGTNISAVSSLCPKCLSRFSKKTFLHKWFLLFKVIFHSEGFLSLL